MHALPTDYSVYSWHGHSCPYVFASRASLWSRVELPVYSTDDSGTMYVGKYWQASVTKYGRIYLQLYADCP